MQRPSPEELENIRAWYQERVETMVREMEAFGLVLTVDQVPLQPLAMGNHTTTVQVRTRMDRHMPWA